MLEQLNLENWKCHSSIKLDFKPGVNIIVGPMGSGKSSLLQAISFALFGTFSELKSKDLKLQDLHSINSPNKTKVELTFKKNTPIKVSRIIDSGKSSEATARSVQKLMAGTTPMQVNDYIKSIIRVDEDTFLQTIYAKQNEIDLYLNLSPQERKQRIDNLMGLNKFEIVRKSATKLRNKLQTKKESKEDIGDKSDLNQLIKQTVDIETEIKDLEIKNQKSSIKLKTMEQQKDKLQIKLKKLDQEKQEVAQLNERRKNLITQLKELEEKLKDEKPLDLEKINTKIKEIQSKISEEQRSKSELGGELETNQKKLLEIENKIGALENKHNDAKQALETIKKTKDQLKALQIYGPIELIGEKINTLEKNIEREKEIIQSSKGTLSTLEKHLVELKESKDLCPICSSELEEETKSRLVYERESDISELNELIQTKTVELNKDQETLFKLKENLDDQKKLLNDIKNEDKIIEKEKETIVALSGAKGQKTSLVGVITSLKAKIKKLEDTIDKNKLNLQDLDKQKQVSTIKDKKESLENQFIATDNSLSKKDFDPKNMQAAEKDFQKIIQDLEKIRAETSSNEILIKEKQIRITDLKNQEKNIKDIQHQISKLKDNIHFLDQFRTTLVLTQEALRKELILAINEIMDSIWQKLYPYGSIDTIKLNATENDYILEFKNKQEWLPLVGYASGGERTLASLALRMAIAKIMSPNFSLLILDEPTHNLDQEAISTLISILQENLSDFLDQIFVVTHEDRLAEAADHVIELKK